jgi:hypothetical protein
MAEYRIAVPGQELASKPAAAIQRALHERRRALIVPREHGAWGLLLVPLITGAGLAVRISTNFFPLVLLLTAALILFWLRTPVESLLGTSALRAQSEEERRYVRFVVGYLLVIAVVASSMLLWAGRNPLLWLMGAVALAAFTAQVVLKKRGRGARMLSEIVGTIGLTSLAPAAYYVTSGRFNAIAWMLWFSNVIFAGNQIHYVQLRIHTARVGGFRAKLTRGWAFVVGQFSMLAVLVLGCARGFMPWIALIAFVPLLLRGWIYFFQKPAPLVVRRLGWSELSHAVAFCVLFIGAFLVH